MPSALTGRLALAGATLGVAALAGCSAVTVPSDPTAGQPTPLADTVTVGQAFCADTAPSPVETRAARAPDPSDACAPYDGYVSGGYVALTHGGGGRLLVAVQVADGTPDPVLRLRRRAGTTFEVDPDALAKVPDAPAGTHWVGYRSSEVRFALHERNAGDVVETSLPVPHGAQRPVSARVSTTIAIGVQVTGDGRGAEYDPNRPVACDERLESTGGGSTDISSTTCPGASGSGPGGNTAPIPRTAATDTTDATVQGPAGEVAVQAGGAVTIPFDVRQAGAAADARLALTASTTAPGAVATPDAATVAWPTPPPAAPADPDEGEGDPDEGAPGDGGPSPVDPRPARAAVPAPTTPAAPVTTAVPVTVRVPADAVAGVYDVALLASDGTEQRSATARLRVSAAPAAPIAAVPAAPTPTAARPQILRRSTVSRRTRRSHLGRVTCARGGRTCSVRVVVRVGTTVVGVQRFRLAAGRSRGITVRLSPDALARLAKASGRATVTVSAPGAAPVVRTTTLAARKG